MERERWRTLIPQTLAEKYEFYNFNGALEILTQAHVEEFSEIVGALEAFSIKTEDIVKKGGNESQVPKNLSALLRPLEWKELEISGDLMVRLLEGKSRKEVSREFTLNEFISGHKIDYVKGEVALDLEWNSKDQTFDRDLYAFRTFYECGVITCGIIVTRSEQLNTVFEKLGDSVKQKYGASTTWMGKLLPRIHARRHGGCPMLVVGITPKTISDWEE